MEPFTLNVVPTLGLDGFGVTGALPSSISLPQTTQVLHIKLFFMVLLFLSGKHFPAACSMVIVEAIAEEYNEA